MFAENEGRDSLNNTPTDPVTKCRRDSLTKLPEQVPVYQRVYSDWKPTIEKTDVVGTMEVIAGMEYFLFRVSADDSKFKSVLAHMQNISLKMFFFRLMKYL